MLLQDTVFNGTSEELFAAHCDNGSASLSCNENAIACVASKVKMLGRAKLRALLS
jgi:hypothetical protein